MKLNQTLLRAYVPFNHHLEEQIVPRSRKPGGQESGNLSPAFTSAIELGGEVSAEQKDEENGREMKEGAGKWHLLLCPKIQGKLIFCLSRVTTSAARHGSALLSTPALHRRRGRILMPGQEL